MLLKKTSSALGTASAKIGQEVILSGWVDSRRDLGNLIFVNLRDRSGVVQIVFSPERNEAAFHQAEEIRGEYVISVRGEVMERAKEVINPNMPTGTIEVAADELEVLNPSKTPPFYIEDGINVDEMLRMKYRYLDLRRPEMQKNFMLRHRVLKTIRDFLDENGFLEVETPILSKSSPEGARDYLVPSRVHPGEFYALPQSPQLFKQLLMVAGFERYFQIARCFRDEDLRADRQPEFTQLDMEMSFINEEMIHEVVEKMIQLVFEKALGRKLTIPFARMTWQEAMDRYGSDKPDLRYDMPIVDVSEAVRDVEFKVFAGAIASGGVVRGLNVKGNASMPRRAIDDLGKFAVSVGAKGLAWVSVGEDGLRSPIAKFFTDEQMERLLKAMEAEKGDLLLFAADTAAIAAKTLGALRVELADRLHLADPDALCFTWVEEFPLLEWDDEENRYVAMHHPFTSPKEEDIPLMETEPGKVRARAYDLVLNGVELGGGSIRIHRRELQEKMFRLIGLSDEEARSKFGYLMDAFEYGTPPHGGIAFGVDRLIMLMGKRQSIRDVIAFPKTTSASCVMTDAPSPVSDKQLEELELTIRK